MRTALLSLKKVVNVLVDGVQIVLFLTVFAVVLCQIFWRYVLGNPISWSEELSRYLFIWICLLGWSQATRGGFHIRITFFFDRLPAAAQKIVDALFKLSTLAFFGYLLHLGVDIAARTWQRPQPSLPWFTAGLIYSMLPVCAALCMFYMILDFIVPDGRREALVME